MAEPRRNDASAADVDETAMPDAAASSVDEGATAGSRTPRGDDAVPLDDVMIAMDVVDTLRHDDRIVARELDEKGRRDGLIERLREIYAAQGIEVPDEILAEGVRALEEDRFTYVPPKPGLVTSLAKLYVQRMAIGRVAGAALAVIFALWFGWYAVYEWPQERREAALQVELTRELPARLDQLTAEITDETDSAIVRAEARQIAGDGRRAAQANDIEAARTAANRLAAMTERLRTSFEVRIVSRRGELSGLWRIPDTNPDARNYYLIVEAVDRNGLRLPQEILNEETGRRETVRAWAQRVPRHVLEAVQRDKTDDGIIQDAVVATKVRGRLEPDWQIEIAGGAITEW